MGRAKKRRGPPAGFLSAKYRKGNTCELQARLGFIGFGGATLLDRIGPPGRCSGGWPHDRNTLSLPDALPISLTSSITLTRARGPGSGLPVCYGVARQRDGSRQKAAGVSGVLSLRH